MAYLGSALQPTTSYGSAYGDYGYRRGDYGRSGYYGRGDYGRGYDTGLRTGGGYYSDPYAERSYSARSRLYDMPSPYLDTYDTDWPNTRRSSYARDDLYYDSYAAPSPYLDVALPRDSYYDRPARYSTQRGLSSSYDLGYSSYRDSSYLGGSYYGADTRVGGLASRPISREELRSSGRFVEDVGSTYRSPMTSSYSSYTPATSSLGRYGGGSYPSSYTADRYAGGAGYASDPFATSRYSAPLGTGALRGSGYAGSGPKMII